MTLPNAFSNFWPASSSVQAISGCLLSPSWIVFSLPPMTLSWIAVTRRQHRGNASCFGPSVPTKGTKTSRKIYNTNFSRPRHFSTNSFQFRLQFSFSSYGSILSSPNSLMLPPFIMSPSCYELYSVYILYVPIAERQGLPRALFPQIVTPTIWTLPDLPPNSAPNEKPLQYSLLPPATTPYPSSPYPSCEFIPRPSTTRPIYHISHNISIYS